MAKLKVSEFIKGLKHLALERKTYYDNSYPSNCGEINPDGTISFDCINLFKSIINEPDICYKTSPSGYFVRPGQVIPDWGEYQLINACPNKSEDFTNLIPGEILIMYKSTGHGGIYVGDFTHNGRNYNVIECTAAWETGVLPSYVDSNGTRYRYKGGSTGGKWEYHGKLVDYLEFDEEPQPQPQPTTIDGRKILAVGIECCDRKWGNNPERKEKLTATYGATAAKKIQDCINLAFRGGDGRSILVVAVECCDKKWGNNPERKIKLTAAYGATTAKQIQDCINLAYN